VIAERRAKLTPREREVMEHLLKGKALKRIASELNVSIPTVSKHRTQVLEKMQVENDVELVKLLLVRETASDSE
jgi:DNA-binding NarL/FixJ family response regulator